MTAAIRNCSLSMRHIQLQYFLYIKTFNLHRTPYAMVSHSVMSDSLQAHVLYPTGLLCAWNSPGNTGVGSCCLFQGLFPTQGWNQISRIATNDQPLFSLHFFIGCSLQYIFNDNNKRSMIISTCMESTVIFITTQLSSSAASTQSASENQPSSHLLPF